MSVTLPASPDHGIRDQALARQQYLQALSLAQRAPVLPWEQTAWFAPFVGQNVMTPQVQTNARGQGATMVVTTSATATTGSVVTSNATITAAATGGTTTTSVNVMQTVSRTMTASVLNDATANTIAATPAAAEAASVNAAHLQLAGNVAATNPATMGAVPVFGGPTSFPQAAAGTWTAPVSYTHLTLPTNREV